MGGQAVVRNDRAQRKRANTTPTASATCRSNQRYIVDIKRSRAEIIAAVILNPETIETGLAGKAQSRRGYNMLHPGVCRSYSQIYECLGVAVDRGLDRQRLTAGRAAVY